MAAAARLNDPIGHSPTMSWLLTGLLVGAAIGVAVAATVATGGLAAVAIVGGAAAGGAGLMEFASTLSVAPKEKVGVIKTPGSGNVFTNGLRAARANLDAAVCDKHSAPATIASGSGTVYINGKPAARVDDKTICSAVVTAGSDNVYIGGPTEITNEIHPENLVPRWVHVALFVVGTGSALVLAAPAVVAGGLVLGMAGGFGGNWAGGKIFGEGSDGQKLMGLAGALVGGFLGAKGGSSLMASRSSGSAATSDDALATVDDALATADEAPATPGANNVESAPDAPVFNPAGAVRAEKFAAMQQKVSARETIKNIAGDDPVVTYTDSGKTLYTNPTTGKQVVYDNAGRYFRVEDTTMKGPLRYTDQFGKPIPNNVPLIKKTGTSQTGVPADVRKALTHFTDSD